MSEAEIADVIVPPEDKYRQVIDYVISKEPKLTEEVVEFVARLDMQYSGLNPSSTLLPDEELQRMVYLDVINNTKVNIQTLKLQAEVHIHALNSKTEMSNWLDGELERQLNLFLSDIALEDDGDQRLYFHETLADIFLHVFTLKNYVHDEIRAALETLVPKEDLKKFFKLDHEV
jgi:hypothetical protein